ncbi:MAG: CapA family protein, partial [Candidatus Pacebacteria bacterium]|nr:CapA family protein [Candidatus Paceibacterota bacterium]
MFGFQEPKYVFYDFAEEAGYSIIRHSSIIKPGMKKKILFFSFICLAVLAVAAYSKGYLGSFFISQNNLADLNIQKETPKPAETTLIAVGDIMLSRGVDSKIKKNGADYPFAKVSDYLKSGDIVFGNLETPIANGRVIKPGELTFRADPGIETTLKDNNFSVISLANNHTGNFGQQGFKETFDLLKEQNIKYAGAGENATEAYSPAIVESNKIKFAFLAYGSASLVPVSYGAADGRAGIAFLDKEKMAAAVAEAKKQADIVIVSMHAGTEYIYTPIE